MRINKANPRKEFFRTDIETVRQIIEQHHGKVEYVADVAALEYYQSINTPEGDSEYIEHVFEEAGKRAVTEDEPLIDQ